MTRARWFMSILCALLFTLTVLPAIAQVATGSAELVWDPVTTYADGSPVSADTLAAIRYTVFWSETSRGTDTTPPSSYTSQQGDINATTYVVEGLTQGAQYFFAVTAYYINTNGDRIESGFSNEATGTVPVEPDTNILASPTSLVIRTLTVISVGQGGQNP